MSDTAPNAALTDATQPRGTVAFERKVSDGNYGTVSAWVSIQFPVSFDDDAATIQAANDAFFQAKTTAYGQLGLKVKYEDGVLREVVEATFGTTTVVHESTPVTSAPPRAPIAAQSSSDGSNEPVCPICKGGVYDNRESKRNPRQPDFRCKNYKPENGGCEGVIWPPKGGSR